LHAHYLQVPTGQVSAVVSESTGSEAGSIHIGQDKVLGKDRLQAITQQSLRRQFDPITEGIPGQAILAEGNLGQEYQECYYAHCSNVWGS
jgi:hypothetical protein